MTNAFLHIVAASTPVVPGIAPTVDAFDYPERIILSAILMGLTVLFFQYRKTEPVFKYIFWLLLSVDLLYAATFVWLAR